MYAITIRSSVHLLGDTFCVYSRFLTSFVWNNKEEKHPRPSPSGRTVTLPWPNVPTAYTSHPKTHLIILHVFVLHIWIRICEELKWIGNKHYWNLKLTKLLPRSVSMVFWSHRNSMLSRGLRFNDTVADYIYNVHLVTVNIKYWKKKCFWIHRIFYNSNIWSFAWFSYSHSIHNLVIEMIMRKKLFVSILK